MKSTNLIPTRPLLVAVALLLTAALPVSAGGPLANCQSGQPYLWPGGGANIPFNPDQGDLGPLTNAAAVAQVQQAFDVWGAIPTATLSYVDAGQLPVDVDITNFGVWLSSPAPDGLSAVVFDDTGEIFDLLFGPGSGVLGFAGPEWGFIPTCEILEGLSFLNGPAFTNATAALDVMVHEFGHWTNFAHTVVNGQAIGFADNTGPTPFDTFGPPPDPFVFDVIETLYPFYFGPGSGTNTLEADDVAIASTMYPAAGFFANTGTIAGTLYAPNGITRLSGVNVIARNVADPFEDAVSAISGDFTDSISQADPFTGVYTLNGLTPGATYAVYVDQILAGGFSTPPILLPGPEEFHNAPNESSDPLVDDPSVYTGITTVAGSPQTGVDVIFNAPAPGEIPLGDDDFAEIFLPFEVTLCGQSFNSVFVNSNGNLTFGSGDTDFTESVGEFLSDQPRIAALWDDLAPNNGGTVSYSQTQNTFTVRFENVPEFFATGANTFEITLQRSADHATVTYGDLTATDGLAGVSCGGALTSGFEGESVLRTVPNHRDVNMNDTTAYYELFSSGDNDLDGYEIEYVNLDKPYDDAFEPNDSLAEAAAIALPFDSIDVSDFTEIEPTGGDVDFFAFSALEDTTLVAEILTGELDTVLGVYDVATGTLLDLDDDGGSGLLSRIVFPIPADGTYAIAVSAFPDFDFSGDGNSGGRYVLDAFTIQGTLLDLGDDDFEEVDLDFSFSYQGQSWTSVFVNSNGNLTFGSGDTDFSESVSEFLSDQPRIAALWDDLAPNNGGLVLVEGDASSFTVRFVDVPEFFSTGANTFAVTLGADGSVTIDYGDVTASDGLVGVTEGGGAANPGETDLSAAASLSAVGTTYEQFSFSDPFDLDFSTLEFEP